MATEIEKNEKSVFYSFLKTTGLLKWFFLSAFVSGIPPFITMYLSQQIIDELNQSPSGERLIFLVIFAVLLNGILFTIAHVLRGIIALNKQKNEILLKAQLAFHQMDLSLEVLESNELETARIDIHQGQMRNGGIQLLLSILQKVVDCGVLIFFALLNILGIVITQSDSEGTSLSKMMIFLLIVLLLFLFFRIRFVQARQEKIIGQLNVEANQANGGAMHYMQLISYYNFGKDIRLFHLENFLGDKLTFLWQSSIGATIMKKIGKEKSKIPQETTLFEVLMLLVFSILIFADTQSGNLSPGFAILCFSTIQLLQKSVLQMVLSLTELQNSLYMMTPIQKILAIKKTTSKQCKMNLMPGPYIITFEKVSFKYEGSGDWALENLNLVIQPNQKIAFVGENGSGKTTAVKLLCRLYTPQKGTIKINGVGIEDFDEQEYQKILSTVFQDFSLLALSLKTNILSDRELDEARFDWLLDQCHLDKFVQDEDETYVTKQYETTGIEFSGGEAQKIAIARAVHQPKPLLILDEPTAALDAKSEKEIFELCNNLVENDCVIYVSHRLSSCQFCDQIFVFEKGNIVQAGNHSCLVNQKGKYQELWQAQAELYDTIKSAVN